MAKNKNQHYVPKCHLKPFSLNGEGSAINVYNHSNDKMIANASVSGQCSRAYFYGKDLRLENIFKEKEGVYAGIIKKLMTDSRSLTDEDLSKLKRFAFLQMNRTEGNVKRRAISHKSFDEIAHRGFEQYRKEVLDFSHERMLISAMRTYVDALYTVKDLKVAILENQTGRDFITSDDPAVVTNRLYLQRLGGRPFGMMSSGVQFFMPLTPRLYLVCYDRDSYTATNIKDYIIAVDKERDVQALNQMHFIRSNENVYFQNWTSAENIRNEFLLSNLSTLVKNILQIEFVGGGLKINPLLNSYLVAHRASQQNK